MTAAPQRTAVASAGTSLFRWGALCLMLAGLLPAVPALLGCQQQAPARADAASASAVGRAALPAVPAALPVAPLATAERTGSWAGGPEPVSGKLRSGIVSWWRTVPAQPQPGEPFQLLLRLEDVQAAGATVSVTTSDGARWADASTARQWALQPGQPAQISLALVAPAGDSHVHVATQQNARPSVRSIRLALGAGHAASAATRGDYATDARGEPIVRMPAGR